MLVGMGDSEKEANKECWVYHCNLTSAVKENSAEWDGSNGRRFFGVFFSPGMLSQGGI